MPGKLRQETIGLDAHQTDAEGLTPTVGWEKVRVASEDGPIPHALDAAHTDLLIDGQWWRPGSHRRCAGQLTWCPERGLVLDVHREIEQSSDASPWVYDFPAIRGNTKQHGKVTLLNARLIQTRSKNDDRSEEGETTRSVYYGDLALLNVHVKDSGLAVQSIDIRMTGLDRWADRYGAVKSIPGGVKWEHVPALVAALPFGQLTLERHLSSRLGLSSAEVRADSGIGLRYDRPTDLLTVLRHGIEPAQDLATFLLGEPCHITDIKVSVSSNASLYLRKQREITLLMAGTRVGGIPSGRPAVTEHVLVTQMVDMFPSVVARWFDLQRDLKLPLSYLLTSEYAPSGFVESAFLQMVQACEALHRRLFDGLTETPEEFAARRARILKRVGDVDRATVNRALAMANEYSLERRIRELLVAIPAKVRQPWGKPGTFATRVANTRNLLSHGLKPSATRQVLDSDGMLQATARLRRIASAHLAPAGLLRRAHP